METFRPSIDLVSSLILFGIIQSMVLLYLFLTKPPVRSNLFLAFFMACLLLITAESFLNRTGFMIYTLHFLNATTPLALLLGPLLYHYTLSLIGGPRPFWRQAVHYLPALFYTGYSFFFFLQSYAFKYNAFIRSYHPGRPLSEVQAIFPTDPLDIQGIVVVEGIVVHLLAYSLAGLYHVRNKKEPGVLPTCKNWLFLINGSSLLAAIVLFLAEGGKINGFVFFRHPLPAYASSVFGAMITYAMSVFLISDTGIFRFNDRNKYQKSGLPDSLRKKQAERLIHYLEMEKPYLSGTFSLSGLAEKTGLKPHHVSQVINKELNTSFFELTHNFRIKEAKKIILESEGQLKMEYLAYQVGYKSKSAFFSAFKKMTGTTPGRFWEESGYKFLFPDGEKPESGSHN